jgi:hypothetical protein
MVEDVEELSIQPQFQAFAYWEPFRKVEVTPDEIRAA